MDQFRIFTREQADQLVFKRPGETRLGETVQFVEGDNWQTALKGSSAPFVLLGIPEDIGVRANYGVGGTQTIWEPALKAILNVQDTDSLRGNKLLVLGAFDFAGLIEQSRSEDAIELRELVSQVDDAVYPVIQAIVAAGKVPIVIGGGHNNAYPILKGASRAFNRHLNCINLDAHSDYRAIEGRHSGNGFRYAKMDGYLGRYSVVGLHRNYNSQAVINEMKSDKDIEFCFFEDMFLYGKRDFHSCIDRALRFIAGERAGIELDLDCIERTLSSAASPVGLTVMQGREYLHSAVQLADLAYLHITEGAVRLEDGREDTATAKLIAYLVTDFLRSCTNKETVFIREAEI